MSIMIAFFLISCALGSNLVLLVGTSSDTPALVRDGLKQLSLPAPATILIVDPELSDSLPSASIVLDFTYTLSGCLKLKQLASDLQIPFISRYFIPAFSQSISYYLHPQPAVVFKALSSMISYLVWDKFVIISSEDSYLIQCARSLRDAYRTQVSNYFIISDKMNLSEVENLMGKMVKISSTRMFLILANAEISSTVVAAIKNKKMLVEGTMVMVFGEAMSQLKDVGVIGIVPHGLEALTPPMNYEASQVQLFLNQLGLKSKFECNGECVKATSQSYFSVLEKTSAFSVINIDSNGRKLVATLSDNTLTKLLNFTYPGDVSSVNLGQKTSILFSYAGGQSNILPEPPSPYNPIQMQGARFAVMVANNDTSLLPNFNFSLVYTDCGIIVNNFTYISTCLNAIPNLGVGFLSHSWSLSTTTYLKYFSPKPVISIDPSLGLSNKTAYPNFSRVIASAAYTAVVIAYTVKVYDWKQVVVLATNSIKMQSIYAEFLKMANSYGIKILNSPEHRTIEDRYTRDMLPMYKDTFTECINSGARIFIMLLSTPDYMNIVEGFYDLGLRRGDMQIIAQINTGGNVCGTELPEYCLKRQELMYGALGVFPAEWVGEYGKEMEKGIASVFGSFTSYKCPTFDSAMLMMRAITGAVNSGYDYEDSYVLDRFIRQSRFMGCSGTISISQDSNDRSSQASNLLNLLDINGTFKETKAAIFDSSSQTPFEILLPIVWCDGTNNTPNDYRFSLNCPFDETKASESSAGFKMLYIITFIIGAIMVIVSGVLIKVAFKENFEEIKAKRVISGQDMVVFGIFVVEVLQHLSLGITPTDSSSVIETFSEICGVNFKRFINLTGQAYWNMTFAAIITCWIITVLCILIILRSKGYLFIRSSTFEFLDYASEYLMPIIGDLGILPIISMLMNLYVCTMSVTNELKETYNSHDCTVFCWTGKHLTLAILSFISLIVFIPLFVYLRPFWQNFQTSLNIKINYRYMIIKSVFQMFAIILSKTVAYSNRTVFACLYTGYLASYGLLMMKLKAFNYGIANLWLSVSLFMTAYAELLYSVSVVTEFSGQNILAALVCGWAGLLILAYFIQTRNYVSYLYSEPSKNVSDLFEFAFGKSQAKYKEGKDSSKDF